MRRLDPYEILVNAEIEDERRFKQIVYLTLLGAAMLGFAIGFVTGYWLK